jgi:Mg-chelatase subunit ChlD
MRRLAAVLAAAFLAAAPAAAQEGSLRLVRCGPEGRSSCLAAEATLRPAEARALAIAGDSGGTWRVRAGPASSDGVRGVVLRESRPPLRLLVLVDMSGSMRIQDGRLQTARAALRGFLAELPAGSVRVALAPFGSTRVAERIGAARFVAPADAVAQVDALPDPDPKANTALYSAVRAGLERLAAERRAAPGGWDALVVVTDGKNDVGHPGDDPGLLAGDAGRAEAVRAIRESGAHAFAVGFGDGVAGAEMRALGSVRGEGFTVAVDPVELRRALTAIGHWVTNSRALLAPVGGAGEARLAAGPVRLTASRQGGARDGAAAGPWTPPVFALPAFQGRPAEGAGVVARPDAWLLRRLAVLAFFGAVLVILWTAVPPLLAAPESAPAPRVRLASSPAFQAASAAPAEGGGSAVRVRLRRGGESVALPLAAAAAAPPPEGGLRRDVSEAPPRRPTDVTARVGRPTARRS